MDWPGLIFLLLFVAALGAGIIFGRLWFRRQSMLYHLIKKHFRPVPLGDLIVAERQFPFRVRADLQRGMDRLFSADTRIVYFGGLRLDQFGTVEFSDLLGGAFSRIRLAPQRYEEIDIGEEHPIRCLKNGLWLLNSKAGRFAVLLTPALSCGTTSGIQFAVATINNEAGRKITDEFFKHLESSVLRAESYRGKILSLDAENSYSGQSTGIKVHKLKTITREQIILPAKTLELLERNVIQFVRNRPQLCRFNQSTRKGILFYGPPGTGKTLTIHYLAKALEGHTTLLITSEQVGLLGEYMALARLLQPSIVVIEDVDLIARNRMLMDNPGQEVLLNKLLNEMDGLKEDANVLFILTTNRPEMLETALASRPGRIDQAIEYPLPDDDGRRKLVRLYSQGVDLTDEVVNAIVRKTEKVSAAFIKELMRRSTQFHLEQSDLKCIDLKDVDDALEEMLFSGGSLNLKLLGAEIDGRAASGGRSRTVAE